MKNTLLTCLAILLGASTNFAQNNVQLNIHHKLADTEFAFNEGAKNNIDHDFNVTRLEYYISEISILHDGGTETAIDDLWILVDASQPTEVDLGSHDIELVERVRFHIGVDPDHNHLDPASWPNGHPLAPTFPSMHWGWAAGYRFVAMEGYGSSDYNQLYQLHGLGDNNYFQTEVEVMASAENGSVTINLDADYARVLENITVNSGVIVHGDYDEAKLALENFRDYVFEASPTVLSATEAGVNTHFDLYPNPAANGTTTVQLSTDDNLADGQITISDLLGRQVQQLTVVDGSTSIELSLDHPGLYLVSLLSNGKVVASERLIVK